MTSSNNLNIETIQRFKEGDCKAFEEVHQYFFEQIRYYAVKIIHNDAEAEDIVSVTFEKLWKLHENFDAPESIRSFLYTTTRNACFDYLKVSKRTVRRHQQFHADLENDWSVEEAGIKAELLQLIFEHSEQLPLKCKEIFDLLYRDGLDRDTIASQLNISPNTIRVQQRRAIMSIRDLIAIKGSLLLALSYLLFS